MDDDFSPIEQAAWGALMGVYGRLLLQIDTDLQLHHQITHAEFELLLRLSWADGQRMRIQDLAARSLLTRSGISRVVERLAQAGLVTREAASEDRRGAYAALTPTGALRLKEALRSHVAFVRRHFLSFFTESDLTRMAEFWRRIDEAASPPAQST